jgi:hypothetical protein
MSTSIKPHGDHRRECRCEANYFKRDSKKSEDVLPFADGELGSKNITVNGNILSIAFKERNGEHGVWLDDGVAIMRDLYCATPEKYQDDRIKKIISLLNEAIFEHDKRSFERHGYSDSKEEAEYVPPYLK